MSPDISSVTWQTLCETQIESIVGIVVYTKLQK